jgi:hypothetical protein
MFLIIFMSDNRTPTILKIFSCPKVELHCILNILNVLLNRTPLLGVLYYLTSKRPYYAAASKIQKMLLYRP